MPFSLNLPDQSLTIESGFLAEEIVDFCHTQKLKYHLSYGPFEEWEFYFTSVKDLHIVRKQFGINAEH